MENTTNTLVTNEPKKKNKGTKVIIIFLLLVILGLGGYIAFDKLLKDKICGETKECPKCEECTKCKETSVINNNKDTGDNEKTADEMYAEYIEGLEKDISSKLDSDDYMSESGFTFDDYEDGTYYSVELNNKKELNLFVGNDRKKTKISDNVVLFNLIQTGNGGFSTVFFVKNDGKLYSMVADEVVMGNKDMEIKKVNLKNIVSINQGAFGMDYSGAWDPIFIDIEGNIVSE